jgi:hypothetical protein
MEAIAEHRVALQLDKNRLDNIMPQRIQIHYVALARVDVIDETRSAQNRVVVQTNEVLVSIHVNFAKRKLVVFLLRELLCHLRWQFECLVDRVDQVLGDLAGKHIEDLVVQREDLEQSESLDDLRAERTPDALVFEEEVKARSADSVTAVDENTRSVGREVVVAIADRALFEVDDLAAEFRGPLPFLLGQESVLV